MFENHQKCRIWGFPKNRQNGPIWHFSSTFVHSKWSSLRSQCEMRLFCDFQTLWALKKLWWTTAFMEFCVEITWSTYIAWELNLALNLTSKEKDRISKMFESLIWIFAPKIICLKNWICPEKMNLKCNVIAFRAKNYTFFSLKIRFVWIFAPKIKIFF